MLPHPTHDRLIALVSSAGQSVRGAAQQPAVASLTFEERLGLLVDREAVERQSKARPRGSSLPASAECDRRGSHTKRRAVSTRHCRQLATGDWIGRRHDLLITGKTGTGKSWLACALGNKACVMIDRCSIIGPTPVDALCAGTRRWTVCTLLKNLARVEL